MRGSRCELTVPCVLSVLSVCFPVVCVSVPTFTVHPGVARPPSPLMIIHNDIDGDEDDDDDDDEDDDEPSVPLEQYRAWLGKLQTEPVDTRLDLL